MLERFHLLDKPEKFDNGKPVFFRLGKTKTANKVRPILIKFTDKTSKFSLLKKWKELKEINLWAQPDMTKKQKEDNQRLVGELKRRREEGENVVISKGKIIERSS